MTDLMLVLCIGVPVYAGAVWFLWRIKYYEPKE